MRGYSNAAFRDRSLFSSFKGSFNINWRPSLLARSFRGEDRFAVRDPILRREYNYSPSIFLAPLPIYPIQGKFKSLSR